MASIDVLAGIVGSDGHLARDKSTVFIINKDIEFMEKIVRPLISEIFGKNPKAKFVNSGFGDGKYKINVSKSEIWRLLVEKYSIPSGAKSTRIQPPELGNFLARIDYFRGWVAGDGSVTNDRERPKIEIWSKSRNMLLWFKQLLSEINIESKFFVDKKRDKYILRIGKKQAVMDFYRKIIIPHPKKQRKLKEMVSKISWSSSN